MENKELIEMLKDRGIELTTEQLSKLKKEKFVPNTDDKYWYVGVLGTVDWDTWDNEYIDSRLLERGNVFKTKEEAQKHDDKVKFLTWFEDEIKANSDEIDWFDNSQRKYFIGFDYDLRIIRITSTSSLKRQGVINSTNVEHLESLIKEYETEIKKYIFEVEE